jgi:predicted transcriptional regulator
MQELEKVDRDALSHSEWVLKALGEIKDHHLTIKNIMRHNAFCAMSDDDIELLAGMLLVFGRLTNKTKGR